MSGIKYWMIWLGVLCTGVSHAEIRGRVGLQTFEQFWKPEFRVEKGILTVYRDQDKIFLEVPERLLGREFVIVAQVDRGNGWRNRYLNSIGYIRIKKNSGNYLCFSRDILQERLRENAGILKNSFEVSNQQPLGLTYPIVAFHGEDKGYIIDISEAVRNGNDWFLCHLPELGRLRPDGTQLKKIITLKDGVCFTLEREYGADSPLNSGLGLEISCVIRLLPEQPLGVRYANPDFPFASLAFTDYGKIPYGAVRDSLICRWRLPVADQDKSEPVVCYIDPLCPSEFVPYIRKGAEAWEKAFRDAGFRQVFQVRLADTLMNLAAEKWVISYDLGKADLERSWVINPETGEILYARLNIGHGVLAPVLAEYWWECGSWDKRICRNRMDTLVAGEILQHLISREIGMLLGLCPRSQNGDLGESVLKDLFYKKRLAEISEQDCRQLTWGYCSFPDTRHVEEEDRLLDESFRRENTRECDKQVSVQFRIFKNRMENRKERFKDLRQQIVQAGKEPGNYRGLYETGINSYNRDLEKLAETLQPGDLRIFLKCMEDCLWTVFPDWLDIPELRREGRVEIESVVQKICRVVFEVVLRPDLLKNAEKEEKCLQQELHRTIWQNFDVSSTPSDYQMEIQKNFLEKFLETGVRNKIYECQDDYSVFWWREWNFLYNKFKEMCEVHQQAEGRDYYAFLLRKMKNSELNK